MIDIPKGLRRAYAGQAIPAIVSMLLTSGVVLVDGAFLGRTVGPEALAAVNLALPLLYAFLGSALLVAVGFSSPATIAIGRGESGLASRYFSAAFITVAVACSIAALVAWASVDGLVAILGRGAGPGLERHLAGYLGSMAPGYAIMMLNMLLMVFTRAEGRPLDALAIGLAANAANVLLDWFFIARLGLGASGAALATGAASVIGCVLGLSRIVRGRSSFRLVRPALGARDYLAALANGASEAIGQYSVTLTAWLVNGACLATMGPAGLAALTVAGYLAFVESMIVTGLCIGMAPIAGRAAGAGDSASGLGVYRLATRACLAAGLASFAVAAVWGQEAAAFWSAGDAEVTLAASRGFALFGLGFLFNGYNACASAWHTALCDPRRSGLIALLRGLALPAAAVLILPPVLGPTGVWLAMPAAEALTLAYAWPASRATAVRYSTISERSPSMASPTRSSTPSFL